MRDAGVFLQVSCLVFVFVPLVTAIVLSPLPTSRCRRCRRCRAGNCLCFCCMAWFHYFCSLAAFFQSISRPAQDHLWRLVPVHLRGTAAGCCRRDLLLRGLAHLRVCACSAVVRDLLLLCSLCPVTRSCLLVGWSRSHRLMNNAEQTIRAAWTARAFAHALRARFARVSALTLSRPST